MSTKRQEIQQELFGTMEIDNTEKHGVLDQADTLDNLGSVDTIEVLERVENIFLVKETAPEAPTFEQGVMRLEHIIGSLEQKDIPLEHALALFREGVELVQECNRMLDQAEAQMQILLEGSDGGLKLEKANV